MENIIKILSPLSIIQQPLKTFATEGLEAPADVQPDLLYMKSVLVSTGQNKNDDVFIPDEMWKARHSPVLKPVDWEHNTGTELLGSALEQLENPKEIIRGNQIIGAMYNSYVADKDGVLIPEDKIQANDFEIPQDFDIINEAVIYKYLFPKAAERIVTQANSDGLFVSMEAWFNKFDYRVGSKIIARNEDTAFLDRHLRNNGGDGFFSGEKIGRVLRNIVFGGVGIVANPANVDSVIQSFTNADYKNTEIANNAVVSNIIGVLNSDSQESQEVYEVMSTPNSEKTPAAAKVATVDNEDYKQVVQQLVKAEHTIETKDKELEVAQAKVTDLEQSAENLKSAFAKGAEAVAGVLGQDSGLDKATAENFFDILAQALTERLSQEDELKTKLSEAQAELKKLEEARVLADRKDKIRDGLGLIVLAEDSEEVKASKIDRINKLVESTQSFSKEAFEQFVKETAELLALAGPGSKNPFAKKEDEDEDKKKKKEASEGITDPSILDGVKPATASVSAGTDNVDGAQGLPEKMRSLAADLMKANKRVQED